MEPKVLRAALSAAIRVTVSTTLLGCGGVTIGGERSQGQADSSGTDNGDQPAAAPATEESSPPESGYGYDDYPSSGGGGQSYSTAGTAAVAMTGGDGGVAQGGGAGAGGSGAGGAPGPVWGCAEVTACLADFEANPIDRFTPRRDPETVACCQAVIGLVRELELECAESLHPRLFEQTWPCCDVLMYPQDTACTPWGPPVPPELELEQLLAWEAVA